MTGTETKGERQRQRERDKERETERERERDRDRERESVTPFLTTAFVSLGLILNTSSKSNTASLKFFNFS